MKYVKVLSVAFLFFIQIGAAAQNVGIGTNAPDGSAKLDIVSTGSGLLIPRMTAAQKNAIATPATGLLIYQTDAPAGFYYYDGSQWLPFLNSSSGWNITGNSGTTNGTHFLGTTDAQSLDIRTNNVIRVRITQKGQIEILNTGNSVFVGEGAGAADDLTSNQNTFVGYQAGNANTTGYYNTASGYQSLYSNTTGFYNTASGYQSLYSNTSGFSNTVYGREALYSNTGNQGSVAIGYRAMYYADNRTIGWATYNTAIGYEALRGSTIAANNTGRYNTATGYQSLYANTSGNNNSASGYQALRSNTTGYNNTATGYQALYLNTTGYYNSASGDRALYNNTTGFRNTASGYQSLYGNTTGFYNTAYGHEALYTNTGNQGSVAIGYRAMYYADNRSTGRITNNTAIGYEALRGSTNPSNNTGRYNTVTGYQSLYANTTGDNNIASGFQTLYSNTTGNNNTAIGHAAGYSSTGSGNVFLGNQAGYSSTGSGNVFLGNLAGYNETGSDKLYIDNSNTTTPLIWGNFAANTLRINGILQVNNPAGTGYAFPAAEGTSGYVLASDGSGTLAWQAVADGSASNELQTITAGSGLTGGGSGLSITLDAVANNGLTANADDIQLGGTLLSTTTLTMGTFNLIHSLDNTGDFIINDGSNSVLRVYGDNGTVVWNESGTANTDVRMESDLNTHMFFIDAGNNRIGINEPAPQSFLQITGNSTASVSQLELQENVANEGARLEFSNSLETTNTWLLFGRADNTMADSKFNLNHTGTGNIIQVIGSGYVGIRQNDATFSLQLPNDVTTGEARANSWTTYSDARIKENIRTLDYGLQAVMALQPRVYTQYASDFENGELVLFKDQKSVNIGFVAQELYEIVPEAAMPPKDENKQLWGVDYTRLIPVLTKAIQEQQEEISRLKKEIEMLKIENRQEIDSLRERMERLEKSSEN